jgi:hypothetical protein
MIEKTPRTRRMSEKELGARIDRVIAEEERTYGRLIDLRDLFRAITGELDSSTASLSNISIVERLGGEPHTRLRYFCSPHHQDSTLYPSIAQLERAAGFRREDTAEHGSRSWRQSWPRGPTISKSRSAASSVLAA